VLDPNPAIAERLRPGMSVIAEISVKSKRKVWASDHDPDLERAVPNFMHPLIHTWLQL